MNPLIIQAFKNGDKIGAPWETNRAGLRTISYSEIMSRADHYPNGTDESDIVNCWCKFIAGYQFSTINQMLLDWCLFHYAAHSATSYGQTWKDHFALIKHLIKQGQVSLERVQKIAIDRNSLGNGALVLVYPVYCYAQSINIDTRYLVVNFARLTHCHPCAIEAVNLLHDIIDRVQAGQPPFVGSDFISMSPAEFIATYPNNVMVIDTLRYAVYCVANADSLETLTTCCVGLSGDVDSTLAISMMLFALIHG